MAMTSDTGPTVPGYTVPGYTVPGYTVPSSTVPSSTVPGSALPGFTLPGSDMPGSTASSAAVPDRRLRLSLLARTGSDSCFLEIVDRALAGPLTTAGDLPLVLYLSLLRAALSDGRPDRVSPFALVGSAVPGDDQEARLRQIRARWSASTRRHLYLSPATWLRALPPPAPQAGNPYSLARLLRVFAGHLAPADYVRAAALTALIEDPGEAAIAQCALVGAGLATHDLVRESNAWARQRHLLTRMPPWSWPGGRTDHDRDVLAYLRPDHRARFDTAIGMLPFSATLGHALLAGLPALAATFRGAYACHGSAIYTEQRLSGRRPDPEAAAAHSEIRRNPAMAGPVVAAVVSANEQVLGGTELLVGDPVYRLSARISARTTRAHRLGAGDLAPEPVPGEFDPRRLPAYAEIVRQNPGTPIVTALAARVRAEAVARNDREALLILAGAGHTDPDLLLDDHGPLTQQGRPGHSEPDRYRGVTGHSGPQARREKPPTRRETAEHDRTAPRGDEAYSPCPEMSVLLFRHRPAEAVRRVADAARADWTAAAAMLEHAAADLIAVTGPRIAHDLYDAVVRAAECAAPPGVAPPAVVDGAYSSQQAAT